MSGITQVYVSYSSDCSKSENGRELRILEVRSALPNAIPYPMANIGSGKERKGV